MLTLLGTACTDRGGAPDPGGPAIVTFKTNPEGGTFRALLEGDDARRAWASHEREGPILVPTGQIGIPVGTIRPGNGDINQPHNWHVTNVELSEAADDDCNYTVSYVDSYIRRHGFNEYVTEHGDQLCPWSAWVMAVEQAN